MALRVAVTVARPAGSHHAALMCMHEIDQPEKRLSWLTLTPILGSTTLCIPQAEGAAARANAAELIIEFVVSVGVVAKLAQQLWQRSQIFLGLCQIRAQWRR